MVAKDRITEQNNKTDKPEQNVLRGLLGVEMLPVLSLHLRHVDYNSYSYRFSRSGNVEKAKNASLGYVPSLAAPLIEGGSVNRGT